MSDKKEPLVEEMLEDVAGGADAFDSLWEYFPNDSGTILQCPECGGTKLEAANLILGKVFRCCACNARFKEEECPHINSGTF